MITLVPLRTHPSPRTMLVIGVGDGETVREICRYPQIGRPGESTRCGGSFTSLLPEISSALNDPRLEIVYQDGRGMSAREDLFDVVI